MGHLVPVEDTLEEDTLVLPLVEEHIQAEVVHSQVVVDSRAVEDSPLAGAGIPVVGDSLERLQDNQVELVVQHQVADYMMEHEMYNKHKDVSKRSDRRNHTNHHLHHEAFPIDGSCARKPRNSYDIKL